MFYFFKKTKKWADWRQASPDDIAVLHEFILKHEFNSVPLSSRLTSDKAKIDKGLLSRNILFIEERNSRIISAVMFSPEGIICPVFTAETSLNPLISLMNESTYIKKRYLTLMGMQDDITSLEMIFKTRKCKSVDYDFLSAKSSNIYSASKQYVSEKNSSFISRLNTRMAELSDLETLMPLRSAYEIEEVILNPSSFNERASKNRFSRTISEETVFFSEIDEKPAGTCCISASGFKWGQIGGVYTKPEYRSKGLSAHLMSEISGNAKKRGIDLMLFVKKDNNPALKLYSNCGFEKNGNYRISYLEIR